MKILVTNQRNPKMNGVYTVDDLTQEEWELMKRLAPAPKCMHPPEDVVKHIESNEWQCMKCGLRAKMTIPHSLFFGDG